MLTTDQGLIAGLTAKMLLEIGAVHFNETKPFIYTSGVASPIYIDCRKLISFPLARTNLIDFAETTILSNIGFNKIQGIAGGETAGIPFAAWIADRLMLPMQYVRKKAKGIGRNAQVEGELAEGTRVLLVDDLMADGRTKLTFCKALRAMGAEVNHLFVLFDFDIFSDTRSMLQGIDLKTHSLATWKDILRAAKDYEYFDNTSLNVVEAFLADPMAWSGRHGGVTSL